MATERELIEQAGLIGWTIERRRSHYTIGYWVALVLGMLGQMVPPPPRITYTLRNESFGERRTVTLSGDHKPADLAAAVRAGAAPEGCRSDRGTR